MSYTKHNFHSGDILYASQLNEMDDAIYDLDERASTLETNTADIPSMNTTITNHAGRLGTLESTTSSHTTRIDTLVDRVDVIDHAIRNMTEEDFSSTDLFDLACWITNFTVGANVSFDANVDHDSGEHYTYDLNNSFRHEFQYLDAAGVTNGPNFETQNSKGYMITFGSSYDPNANYCVDIAGADGEEKNVCQLIVEYPNGRIHTRCYVNDTWSPWVSLATKDEVDNLAARVEALEGNQ